MGTETGAFRQDIRQLVRRLGKMPEEWQRQDLLELCMSEGIRVLNLRYPALDGKLKELRLPVNNRAYLERVLAAGERVDGSSLFPGVLDPTDSDLYVVPVYRWAFLNPWAEDELDIVCRFADRDGVPCTSTPDNLLFVAAEQLTSSSGAELRALAELEFYLILDRPDDRFTARAQRNYHQSAPYLHGGVLANEILRTLSATCGCVKYSHSEVGYIDRMESADPELNGKRVEQHEVEFDLVPVGDLGCWISVAKWLIRVIADRHGASVTFLPKLDEDMAGSGLHLHLALFRKGENVMLDKHDEMSEDALKLIGGVLKHAAPLTAFGNTVAASYLRLVPHQEAPTNVCWAIGNRTSLMRVPLSFATGQRLDKVMNPDETGSWPPGSRRPTVELRSPDGSAFVNQLLTAVTMCVADGLSSGESIELARALRIKGDLQRQPEVQQALERLPQTAVAAAKLLQGRRSFFEDRGFPPRLIDIVISKLRDEDDEGLSEKLRNLPAAERLKRSRSLMHKDLHKH